MTTGGGGGLRLPKQEASPLPGARRLAPLPSREDPLDRTGASLAMSLATELSIDDREPQARRGPPGFRSDDPFADADGRM